MTLYSNCTVLEDYLGMRSLQFIAKPSQYLMIPSPQNALNKKQKKEKNGQTQLSAEPFLLDF
jgi:hypothetical protein